MTEEAQPESHPNSDVRWPAWIAVLAVAGLYTAVPKDLSVGPRWAVFEVVVLLLVMMQAFNRRKHPNVYRCLSIGVTGTVTLAILYSLGLLVIALPAHKETPFRLLGSAGALWISNVLVFALWYWGLDAGGPTKRAGRHSHLDGAFLFPQMAMDAHTRAVTGEEAWMPSFIDYLFLAFNTSTALSPTDTAVLSKWAKVLMMLQSLISMGIIALLAGRVVNIL